MPQCIKLISVVTEERYDYKNGKTMLHPRLQPAHKGFYTVFIYMFSVGVCISLHVLDLDYDRRMSPTTVVEITYDLG